MWQVLLLGGASGVGKTSVSYRLAQHYGVALTEVDDFQLVLQHMTPPEQYPVLHYWRTHTEEALRMSDHEHVDFYRRYSAVISEALTVVIANHIETRTPIVLEGDFILPSLAVQERFGDLKANGRVKALFLYEQDEEQIGRNYLLREGSEQRQRAHISWCVSEWLRSESERLALPSLPARPWETILERAVAAIGPGPVPILK